MYPSHHNTVAALQDHDYETHVEDSSQITIIMTKQEVCWCVCAHIAESTFILSHVLPSLFLLMVFPSLQSALKQEEDESVVGSGQFLNDYTGEK